MMRKSGSLYRTIPLVYLLLIVILLVLHFTRFEDISLVMENVSFKGVKTEASQFSPAKITRMQVLSNGLKMVFSTKYPMTMTTEDGIVRKVPLERLERIDNGIRLHFKHDVLIEASSLINSKNSSIKITVPHTIPPVKELAIESRTQESYQISLDEQNRMNLSDGTSNFFINSTGIIEYRDGALLISMEDRVSSTITLEDEAPGLGRTLREWLSEGSHEIPTKPSISQGFLEKSYSGWKSRFDNSTGNWTMPNSTPDFSENALVYFIQESYRRNDFSTYAADLIKAGEKNSEDLTWFSSPYTGDIVNKTAALIRTSPAALLSHQNSLSLSANPDISPYKEILALEKVLNDTSHEDPVAWIEENIYPLIVWLEEGLYIFHPDNPKADLYYSLETVRLLEKASELTSNDQLYQISSALLSSLLGRADEKGSLPESIIFSREHASQEEGRIPAEQIAQLFISDSYSPRMIDLTDELGEGSWIFTAAKSAQIQKTETELIIDIRFPKGQIHHFVLKGVEPFDRLFLHSIRWKSDPRFQRYSDGWVYDSVNKALYLKIKHRADQERIRVLFNMPESEIPADPADSETPINTDGETPTTENTTTQN